MKLPRLITIPISHYCDKARWALDHVGIAYTEETHLQVFSWLPAFSAARSRFLPILVTRGGVYKDSTDILKYADRLAEDSKKIYPKDPKECQEVVALEQQFCGVLGPATRLWCYQQLFEHKAIVLKYNPYQVPAIERFLFPSVLPLMIAMGKKILAMTPRSLANSWRIINETFDRMDRRLETGQEFLIGNSLSAADISLASMLAPVLMPPNYGVPIPEPEEFGERVAGTMLGFRKRVTGRFAMNLYEKHRGVSSSAR